MHPAGCIYKGFFKTHIYTYATKFDYHCTFRKYPKVDTTKRSTTTNTTGKLLRKYI